MRPLVIRACAIATGCFVFLVAAHASPPAPHPAKSGEPLVPCPDKAVLAQWITDAIHPDDATSVKVLGCASGHFPHPGWAVVAEADSQIHQLIQDAHSPAMLARADLRAEVGADLERAGAIDFDGDGVDELTDEFFINHHGVSQRILFVLHKQGDKLEESLALTTYSDNEQAAANEKAHDIYEAKVEKGPVGKDGQRALLIDGAMKKGHAGREWIVGHAELRWKDGKLVKR